MIPVGGKHVVPALAVVRESAGGEDNSQRTPNLHISLGRGQHRSAHGATVFEEPDRRGRRPQVNAEIGSGAQQPPHQSDTVAQLHASPVRSKVNQVPAEATSYMDEGAG